MRSHRSCGVIGRRGRQARRPPGAFIDRGNPSPRDRSRGGWLMTDAAPIRDDDFDDLVAAVYRAGASLLMGNPAYWAG